MTVPSATYPWSICSPYDLLVRCPTLRKLPCSMGALNTSEWGEVIGSAAFYNEIMDAVASLAFPHFGFGGWKEHYTGWCPVWRLSYALPLWAKGVERVRGWGCKPSLPCRPITKYRSLTRRT